MRYHKAIKISRPEAHYIINTCTRSLGELVVVSHHQQWYDLRSLTNKEIDDFYSDLMRADLVNLRQPRMSRHRRMPLAGGAV